MESETNPAKLTFVTGNQGKFVEAAKVARCFGVELEVGALEIDEIQS